MKARYWLARLAVASHALVIPLLAWLEPQSLTARALSASGPLCAVFLFVLAVLCFLAMLDVALNDLLSSRRLTRIKDQRHVGYMLMGIVLMMLSTVIFKQLGPTPLLLYFWLPVLFCLVIVPLDMKARHQR